MFQPASISFGADRVNEVFTVAVAALPGFYIGFLACKVPIAHFHHFFQPGLLHEWRHLPRAMRGGIRGRSEVGPACCSHTRVKKGEEQTAKVAVGAILAPYTSAAVILLAKEW